MQAVLQLLLKAPSTHTFADILITAGSTPHPNGIALLAKNALADPKADLSEAERKRLEGLVTTNRNRRVEILLTHYEYELLTDLLGLRLTNKLLRALLFAAAERVVLDRDVEERERNTL